MVTYQFWSSEIILLLLSQYLLPESFTYLVSVLRMSSIAAICSRVWVSSRISWKNNFNLSCIGSVACPLLGPGQWLPPTPTHAGSHISPCYISLIDHYSQTYNGPSLCKYCESDKVLTMILSSPSHVESLHSGKICGIRHRCLLTFWQKDSLKIGYFC